MAPCINSLLITPIFCIGQLFFIATMIATGVGSIGCFVCSSFNGSNPTCEDTFNSTVYREEPNTIGISNYQYPCWAFKKQRHGLFPADHCIKVNGHRTDDSSQTMVIRTCALDSGTLTADTEIVRISHCGHFKYEGHQYSGCVQACDTDGCNGAYRTSGRRSYAMSSLLPVFLVSIILHCYGLLPDFVILSIDIVNRVPQRVYSCSFCCYCCAALLVIVFVPLPMFRATWITIPPLLSR